MTSNLQSHISQLQVKKKIIQKKKKTNTTKTCTNGTICFISLVKMKILEKQKKKKDNGR